jgi:hypothetical protein
MKTVALFLLTISVGSGCATNGIPLRINQGTAHLDLESPGLLIELPAPYEATAYKASRSQACRPSEVYYIVRKRSPFAEMGIYIGDDNYPLLSRPSDAVKAEGKVGAREVVWHRWRQRHLGATSCLSETSLSDFFQPPPPYPSNQELGRMSQSELDYLILRHSRRDLKVHIGIVSDTREAANALEALAATIQVREARQPAPGGDCLKAPPQE